MNRYSLERPPYFDWALDAWKLAIIVVLFLSVLFGTLFGPSWAEGTPVRNRPEMTDATAAQAQATTAAATAEAAAAATVQASAAQDSSEPPAQPSGAALPLTLASLGPNAVVSSAGIASLSGTGQAVSRIEVRDQLIVQADIEQVPVPAAEENLIGVTTVDERGLWTVPLQNVLEPGQHIITLRAVDENGSILSVSPPAVVLVLESGQQGPLSLATPVIRFPAPGARLRTGPVVFLGSGLPGMRVQLLIDGQPMAEGVVNSREEWRLSPEEEFTPGVYVARVAALDPQGQVVAESPPVAFSVVEPIEGLAPAEAITTPVTASVFAVPPF